LAQLKQSWWPGDTVSASIGQGYVTVTAMQLARMVSAVATGKLVKPHLVRKVGGSVLPVPPVEDLGLKPETLAAVHEGMKLVVQPGGTGWRAALPGTPITVCGKTGTAQVVQRSRLASDESLENQPHGWFVGFAPADDPQIAVAIMVEHAGGGGVAAAPIAHELFAQFFHVKSAPAVPAPAPVPTAAPVIAASPIG
jgi:penicillin-binding protein 2